MVSFPASQHPASQPLNCRVLKAAAARQLKIYLVGGYIRDALSGRLGQTKQPLDLDYAVIGGSAVQFARLLAEEIGGHFVLLDQALDTARVVTDAGEMVDLAGCQGNDFKEDIARRDFTVNALAWDPDNPDEIIDLVGGLPDLDQKLIRAIAEQNFLDDPLRMLRAFRFATTLDGTIEKTTAETIARHASILTRSAPERISSELFAIARSPSASSSFKALGESGLLEVIFPELTRTRQVTPNAFHHLGLWDHSLQAVVESEKKLADLPSWVHEQQNSELSYGVTRLAATNVATLLHDIGKPDTWQITPEGRHTFYGHDRVGAEMCEVIAERLRWSKQTTRFVVKLIRWHLRPGQLFHQGPPTERAILRFYKTIGEDVPSLMVLAFGDLGATRGPGLEGENRLSLEKNLFELLEQFPVYIKGQENTERLLDGHQIMNLLGIPAGPVLGELLEALAEAHSLKEVSNKAEAEQFLRELYKEKYCR